MPFHEWLYSDPAAARGSHSLFLCNHQAVESGEGEQYKFRDCQLGVTFRIRPFGNDAPLCVLRVLAVIGPDIMAASSSF